MIFNRFTLFAIACYGLLQPCCKAQESLNLLVNPGFEEPLTDADWYADPNPFTSRSTENRIEREHALVIDHGNTVTSSGLGQLLDPSAFVVGNDYILSANVRMDSGSEQLTECVTLTARFHDDPGLDQSLIWQPGSDRHWRKLLKRIRVPPVPPGNSASIRIELQAINTAGRTWFDYVQLVPSTPVLQGPTADGQNMVANGCFDAMSLVARHSIPSWVSSGEGVSLDSTESFFGSQSLRIQGAAGQFRFAQQSILLDGREFEPDIPIYTISAHIKSTFSGTPPPAAIYTNYWDRIPVNPSNGETPTPILPELPSRGAAIVVRCLGNDGFIRPVKVPLLNANYDEFCERKFSFLVPAGTTEIQLLASVRDSEMTAWFDNVRLVKNNPVAGGEFASRLGPDWGVVEAPELGAAVDSDDYATIQDAVDDVSNPTSGNYGRLVWVPPMDYFGDGNPLILRRIFLKSGLHLKMHKDARFFRSHEAAGVNGGLYASMWHGAFIRNVDWYSPISDVIVEGGQFFNHLVENEQGNLFTAGSVIANCCDRFVCRNIDIGKHGVPDDQPSTAASAIWLLGHDIFVHNNRIADPEGVTAKDGIHLWGGDRLHVMSNDIETGDDALAVASSPNSNLFQGFRSQVIHNRNLADIEIFNNLLISHNARVLHTGMANSVVFGDLPFPRMTNSVQNIRFRNFVGLCGGRNQMLNIVVVPAPTTADPKRWWPFPMDALVMSQVRDIFVSNGDLQGTDQLELTMRRPPVGVRIRSDDVGSVFNVQFDNVRVRNVAPEFDGNLLLQSSSIFSVEKVVWYNAPQERIDLVGHDNHFVRCQNCIFDADSLDSNNQPDDGIDADFLYFIDGLMNVEVDNLEATEFNNLLNSHSPNQPGPGLRLWNEDFHSGQ